MIRYNFINNLVLQIYKKLPSISFPLNIDDVVGLFHNCRYMSYQEFAAINHCNIEDVIQLCESVSGSTHYDALRDRYLILCNHSKDYSNSTGRQLWTAFHEMGHILCKHHLVSESVLNRADIEAEADYFAATMLAPFPLFCVLNIKSVRDLQIRFGLSIEASVIRYKYYLRWKQTHFKTAWENDMTNTYMLKRAVV